MTSSKRWALCGCALVVVSAAAVRLRTVEPVGRREASPASADANVASNSPIAAPMTSAPPPTRRAPDARAAAAITPPPRDGDAAAAMRDALAWTDDAARIDAVNAAASNGAIGALPALEAVTLPRDPEAAPAIIQAVATLGAQAPEGDRARAEGTLARWLREESTREGADARGNVSLLVDALGAVGGGDAVDALAAALDGGALPLHVETLAARDLSQLGDPRGAAAVARFAERVAALPKTDGLDEELRQEAIATAAAAVDRLSR